jgi:hypothetical protein
MIQHGYESATPGTLVAATFKHLGNGELEFIDKIKAHGFDYNVGSHTGIVEQAALGETGSRLTLSDFPFSAEAAIWHFNAAIKQIAGPASSFAFAFPVPGAAPNAISTFTWEMQLEAVQEYELGYGFISKFSVHGDESQNDGVIMMNAVVEGRQAAASTVTAALGFLAARETLVIPRSTIKIDPLGTAPGTASATAGWLKAFNIDVESGWVPGYYASGRTANDWDVPDYQGYKITGTIRVLMGATAITHIALARAGTGKNIEIACNGSSSRKVAFAMPILYTSAPKVGATDKNGLQLVEMDFQAGDSITATAASPSFVVTASASTTVT